MILTYNDHKYETLYNSRYYGTDVDSLLQRSCMYCGDNLIRQEKNGGLTTYSRNSSTGRIESATASDDKRVLLRCEHCGWWLVLWNSYERDLSGKKRYQVDHYWGILKRYQLNDLNLPLRELRDHIDKNPEKIWALQPKQFGRLMNDCFKNTMNCYVDYVDGPHDRGADAFLYVVETGSTPYLVQYKARQSPKPSESVSVIRDVLGAMVDNEVRKGIVVTTRKNWSYDSIALATRDSLMRQGFYLELYDASRLIELVAGLKSSDSEPWVPFFDPVILRPEFLRQVIKDEKKRSQ